MCRRELSFRNLEKKPVCQKNGFMKATLELPEALVKQVKLRAIRDGRKLKDAVADLLRKGLAAEADAAPAGPPIQTDKSTGLPLTECLHAAAPDEEMTADRVAEILLTQDANWNHDAGR